MSNSSDSAEEALIQSYLEAYHDVITYSQCLVAALVLFAYDYLVTFSQGVAFVWGRQFTGATLLFILIRHLPLFQAILNIVYVLPWPNQSPQSCIAPSVLLNIFIIGTNIVFALFSALRGFALWNRNWWLFSLLLAMGLIFPVVEIAIDSSSQIDAFESPEWGCAQDLFLSLTIYKRLIVSARVSSIVLSILVLILTWIRTYGIQRLAAQAEVKSSISTMLLRDGTLYFFIMLAFNIAELVMFFIDSSWFPVDAFIGVMQSILISRFMFNLREVYHSDERGETSHHGGSQIATLRFATNVAGNMGASLIQPSFTRSDDDDDVDSAEEHDTPPVFSADPLMEGLFPSKAIQLSPVSSDMTGRPDGSTTFSSFHNEEAVEV